MKKYRLFFGCLALCLVSGCANSITYHHSERNSIALEARTTDPVLPVQGTIGIRTRTIVVSPGTKIEASNASEADSGNTGGDAGLTNEAGESASLVSDFSFKREPVDGPHFGKTTIESAFITGAAAVAAPYQTMTAISGAGAGRVDEMSQQVNQTLRQIYDALETMGKKDEQAKLLQARLDLLGGLLPKDISKNRYYDIEDADLIETAPLSISDYTQNFIGVLEYETLLRTQIETIDKVFNNRAITYDKKPIDGERLKILGADKQRMEKEREEFSSTIGNSPVIDAAAAYVIKDL